MPPFTALTGAFGRGEGDPPPHRDATALARLLLEAGADPNDGQAVYNLHWHPDDEWLELLLEFGFGSGDGGVWHRRLGAAHASPRENAEDCLMWAALQGYAHRVGLLLAAGVDPDGRGTEHPILQGRSALEVALGHGHTDTAAALRAAGAADPELTDAEPVEVAYMAADPTVTAPPPPGLISARRSPAAPPRSPCCSNAARTSTRCPAAAPHSTKPPSAATARSSTSSSPPAPTPPSATASSTPTPPAGRPTPATPTSPRT